MNVDPERTEQKMPYCVLIPSSGVRQDQQRLAAKNHNKFLSALHNLWLLKDVFSQEILYFKIRMKLSTCS